MVKAQDKNIQDITPYLRIKFHNFLNSLSDVLIDITALEVNTMVVEQITGNKFIPWEAYQEIYLISSVYLEKIEVHPFIRPQYLNLRKKLEMEYCLFLLEDEIDRREAIELKQYYQMLGDPTLEFNPQKTKLPNPLNTSANTAAEIEKISILLDDGRFLRSLRKMSELKVALDSRNIALSKSELSKLEKPEDAVTTDIIYAQTIIQMDGDIINRYDRKLFEHEHKDIILDIHKQGVTAGEKQWRGLLEFMVNLVGSLVNHHGLSRDFSNRN